MGAPLTLALALAAVAQPTRLFADDPPIRATVRGPISQILATPAPARTARPATLALTAPSAEQHMILLSPRGLTRRSKKTCNFPPLRVEFVAKPPKTSLFERQKRLKLVTHCRTAPAHQNYVLMEYAAYRMLNLLNPVSLRVRLGTFDYVEQDGRSFMSRLGFFIEDPDDAAKRNGLEEVRSMVRIQASQLDPDAAARAAMFEYMIGNTDWSMRAGPAGDTCCHNFRLLGTTASARQGLVPVPYDFDASGLVNAPYAVPPAGLGLSSVRERRYRGYCMHNAQALKAAAEFRARRGDVMAVLAAIPGLDDGRRRSAQAYLEGFFRDIATDDEIRKRLLRTCFT